MNYTAQYCDAHKFLVVSDDNGGKTTGIITPVTPETITPIES